MKLLLTGAASPLGRALTEGLRSSHQLRLTARAPLETVLEFVQSDLGHDAATDALVAGLDAIIYQPEPVADSAAGWIEACTRCTYNLLLAATDAGVERVIYLSSLDLLLGWDQGMDVTEDWQPRPSCEPSVLGPYLGEFVAQEFAHTRSLELLCLRLGHVISAAEATGRPFDPMWVEPRDVAQAVAAALQKDLPPFQILHFQSASERARFNSERARKVLGYEPRFNFEEVS